MGRVYKVENLKADTLFGGGGGHEADGKKSWELKAKWGTKS